MHVDHGRVDRVDMAATNLGIFGILTGTFENGSIRTVGVLDEKDTEEQQEVMRQLLRGQLEGPLGDLGGLVELVAFETASFEARQSTQTTFRYAYL